MNNEKEKDEKKEQVPSGQPEKIEKADVLPPTVAEFLKATKAPPDVRRLIGEMASFSFTAGIHPPVHPIFEKFTPEHISKFLDYTHDDDQNNYKLERSGRWIHLIWAVIVLAFLVFLVVFLARDNVVLLNEILRVLLAFAGGFGGGFGYRAYLAKNK